MDMDLGGVPRDWLHPPSLAVATEAQRAIAARVVAEDRPVPEGGDPPRRVVGVDASYKARDGVDWVHAAVVALDGETRRPTGVAHASGPAAFPYVPGFFAFREVPPLLEAFARLPERPHLVLVDGHGLSHPRGCGLASHLGALLDLPTVGVAKTILVGRPEREVGPEVGDRVPLLHRGREVGAVLRTRRKVAPVYVSVGHRVSLGGAVAHVMRWLGGYRLPEPTRLADKAAGEARRAEEERSRPL